MTISPTAVAREVVSGRFVAIKGERSEELHQRVVALQQSDEGMNISDTAFSAMNRLVLYSKSIKVYCKATHSPDLRNSLRLYFVISTLN